MVETRDTVDGRCHGNVIIGGVKFLALQSEKARWLGKVLTSMAMSTKLRKFRFETSKISTPHLVFKLLAPNFLGTRQRWSVECGRRFKEGSKEALTNGNLPW